MERPLEGSFYRELKALDKRLDCYLNYTIQRRRNLKTPLWCITYNRSHKEPIILRVIHDGNYGYRYPNKTDLEWLGDRDMCKDDVKSRIDHTAYIMEQARELQEKKANDEIRDMTKDGRYQLMYHMGKAGGSGKGTKHVRPIEVKPKGFKVIDRRLNKTNNTTDSTGE